MNIYANHFTLEEFCCHAETRQTCVYNLYVCQGYMVNEL